MYASLLELLKQAEGQRLDALRLLVVLENPGTDVTLSKEHTWNTLGLDERSTRKARLGHVDVLKASAQLELETGAVS